MTCQREAQTSTRLICCVSSNGAQISMVDATLFESLESVARHVRKCKAPFGGIQLILTGASYSATTAHMGCKCPTNLHEQLSG